MNNHHTSKILVCVDQHPESHVALKFACMRAKLRGAQLQMLHVVAPADFQTLGGIAERMREELRAEGEALLERLALESQNQFGVAAQRILKEGAAGEEIIENVASDVSIGLLIIGTAHHTKGRGTLAAWLAHQLGQKIFIPLVMVPGNLTDEQLQLLM